MEAPAPAPAAPPTATASAEVRAALSGFLDWVATPPGWPLRCVLAENRKNRSGSFDPAHVDFTASSNGTLPWPFGHPDEETGLFEAVATMVPAELGVRFLRRLGNTSGMSSNVYELEVLGSFRAAYKTCHLRERSPLVRERQVMPAIRAAAPQYSFEQYDVRQYEAALELAGDGGTVHDWACAPGSPAPGTPERRRWARRCNALTLDALRLIHDAGFFHADLKPQNLLLLQPDAADPEAFEVRVCDWEQDNWPARDAACGPARSRLRDNLMLARCVCAVYCDLCAFCASEQLRKRRSFFHWNQVSGSGYVVVRPPRLHSEFTSTFFGSSIRT